MILRMDLGERSYDITVERGCVAGAADLLDTARKCLIVTDDGVPSVYAETVAAQCSEPLVMTVPQGEGSKSMKRLEELLTAMLDAGFTRKDCVIAVGGGVPGDLAGFAAAVYMRGIDFYNIPTTLLSQADSSIGGKTAVDLAGAKNAVGAFHQPKAVLIDPDTLETLPARQRAAGLAEIVKAGLIGDAGLFGMFEAAAAEMPDAAVDKGGPEAALSGPDLMAAACAALRVKKAVVEADEREAGLRRVLNFGHTIGHGIESVTGLLHGECVALGMIPMCSDPVRSRLTAVLESLGLPVQTECDADAVLEAVRSDKKMQGGMIAAVYVDEPGSASIRMMTVEEIRERIGMVVR